ncbi:MAG: FGGY-family carbohydrate kinase [Thermoguttaceae bacterium]
MKDLLLGIDLGSTSIKAIVYDVRGNVVARGTRPMQRFHPSIDHPEWTVWDPQVLWAETAAACREAVTQLADPQKICGVATTGMGMDGLPMSEDDKPLYPLISWYDTRTQPQYEWWLKHITSEKTYSIGGNPVWAINSALRMLWMRDNEPAIFAQTKKWLLIEDYLNERLTGVYATDFSMASCTMLFDQRTLSWSDELCVLSGVPRSILPEPFVSSTRIGEVTAAASQLTGLPQGTPVFLGGHDHICSSLPVGAFRPDVVLNITGTWEMIDVVSQEPPVSMPLGRSGVTTQTHVLPNRFMVWSGNPAGEMLEWYRRSLVPLYGETAPLIDWETVVRLASSAGAGSGGVLFLPHLSGASCPQVDPRSRGAYVGLNTRVTQAEMVRSIFEGLSYQLMDVISTIESSTHKRATELIAVGGATRNRFWMQNKADILGRPVRVPQVEEATVLGAAILAGIGAGVYKDADDAFTQIAPRAETFTPDETLTRLYEDHFKIYRQLYAATAPLHHAVGE